jgi:hypothetical protein
MNLINVEFIAKNEAFLLKALESLGLPFEEIQGNWGLIIKVNGIKIDLAEQNVEAERYQFKTINRIKRQYAREVIAEVAKKKRWILKQQNNRKIQLKKW